jgi:hypothetical protein
MERWAVVLVKSARIRLSSVKGEDKLLCSIKLDLVNGINNFHHIFALAANFLQSEGG